MGKNKAYDHVIDEQLAAHPEMQVTERIIFVLLITFVALRIAPAVLQTIYVSSTGGAKTDCLMNYILVVLCALFAVMIAQGTKFFALLGMLCGSYSLLALWLDHLFSGGSAPVGGALYTAYVVVLIVVCLAQISIMLYLLFSRRCRAYLTLLDSVNKDYFNGGAST